MTPSSLHDAQLHMHAAGCMLVLMLNIALLAMSTTLDTSEKYSALMITYLLLLQHLELHTSTTRARGERTCTALPRPLHLRVCKCKSLLFDARK
jgi:hypothetical protein